MKNITFLFGAGASAKALPVINEIPGRIQELIDIINRPEFQLDKFNPFSKLSQTTKISQYEYQQMLIENLIWLKEESMKHASIDTYAKKLHIRGDSEKLRALKIVLSVFFVFEQALNRVDDRYDAFFASLLNNISELPNNIRILSWNYDYQFEMAFSEYTDNHNITSIQNWLRITSKYGIENNDTEGFGIFKLNGTTALRSMRAMRDFLFASNLNIVVDKKFVYSVTEQYTTALFAPELNPSLSFAWEEEGERNIVDKAIKRTKGTNILVVIGYSFPFFNREVDRKIIGSMGSLQKVYFQSKEPDALIERFQSIRNDINHNLVAMYDVEQFLLPNEL